MKLKGEKNHIYYFLCHQVEHMNYMNLIF